jgi:uncharacterized protein YukE
MSGDRTTQPERLEVDTPNVPIHQSGLVTLNGFELDNVNRAHTPSDLVAGPNEAGVKTEWDASSLDSAIRWLESHASYLNRLSYDMTDLQDLMGGQTAASGAAVPGAKSPLGGFEWAGRLAQKHGGLYTGVEQGVRALSKSLYDAAEALRQVKENYETAEEVNRMTAVDMQKIFGDIARGGESQ